MYENILVPLDSSERAEEILPHVEELCGIKMGKVILVHVVEPPAFVPAGALPAGSAAVVNPEAYMDQIDALRAAGEKYLTKIQTILKTKGIEAEVVIESGPIAERIIHVAEQKDADLIALASHGRTGLSRVVFGSVAAAVLHRTETPLLLIRSRDHEPRQ